MNYLIGALFGILLVLAVLGGFIYFNYLEVESYQHEVEVVSAKHDNKPTSETNQPTHHSSKRLNHKSSNQQNKTVKKVNKQPSSSSQPIIYTWTDSNGKKRFSETPPSSGNYQIQELSDEGFSVIPMERVKPIQRSTNSERQTNVGYQNPGAIKDQLLAKNHTHCRWVVGRAYETYLKIEQHTGPNRSIYCDEYRERLIEMRKLSRKGEACYYPYGNSAKC